MEIKYYFFYYYFLQTPRLLILTTFFIASTWEAAGQSSCHVRKCDQQVTGRGLSYQRSLEVVQNEEYLTEADLDVLRRRKRREIGQGRDFKIKLDVRTNEGCISFKKRNVTRKFTTCSQLW